MYMIDLVINYVNKNLFVIIPSLNRILCIFLLSSINFQTLQDFITLIPEIKSVRIVKVF